MKTLIAFFTILTLTSVAFSQQNVTYNGKTFNKAEVVETQVGTWGKSFSFYISEHDLSPNGTWAKKVKRLESMGKIVDPLDAPRGLSLHLSVNLKNGMPFPIKPTDSIVISLSNIKNELHKEKLFKSELNKIETKKIKEEGKGLRTKKVSVEAQAKEITKQMLAGKITPEEAADKIEALANPLIEEVQNSAGYNINIKEPEERSYYDILFSDTNKNIESIIVEGNLHIVEFNKKKLVAYISGKHFVECTDVERQNSETKICKRVNSQLYPGLKVFEEGPIKLNINSTFQNFRDNRN